MGTGGSTRAGEITVKKEKNNENNKDSTVEYFNKNCLKCVNFKSKLDEEQKKLKDLEMKFKVLEEENENLKKQINDIENENDELVEENTNLQQHLESLNSHDSIKQDFEKIIEAKNKTIKSLETKLDTQKKLFDEIKVKSEAKIEKLQSKIEELKKTQAIKVLELRDQISKMSNENKFLNEKANIYSDNNSNDDNSTTKLIVELSNHLNEKESQIEKLNEEIEERDNKIMDLQAKLNKQTMKSSLTNVNNLSNAEYINNSTLKNRNNSAPAKSPRLSSNTSNQCITNAFEKTKIDKFANNKDNGYTDESITIVEKFNKPNWNKNKTSKIGNNNATKKTNSDFNNQLFDSNEFSN